MSSVTDQLGGLDEKVERAVSAVDADGGASPVLHAVVTEFQRKLGKAHGLADDGDDRTVREAVVELEQAGDSAKAAAEADPGASDSTRRAVADAHLAICMLKAEM